MNDSKSLAKAVCTETGISFSLSIESAIASVPALHPFSNASLVREIQTRFQAQGKKLQDEFFPSTLAGMLLSLLRSENLCLCKNPIEANKYLCSAGKDSLVNAIRFLCARSSYKGFPRLSLVDFSINHFWGFDTKGKTEAQILLDSYIGVCQGKLSTDSRIMVPVEEKREKGVKVYVDKVKAEGINLRNTKADGLVLLSRLEKKFGHKFASSLKNIKEAFANLATMKESRRQGLADSIEMIFEDSEDALELASLFRKANTKAIQEDLQGVITTENVGSVQKDAASGRIKVDFLSKLSSVKVS